MPNHTGPPLRYPIRAVARMTGISLDTLRAWERRYEAVVPERNERGRLYSEADVARLKRLDELVKRGHAIGTIAGATDADLTSLLDGGDSLKEVAPQAPPAIANLDDLAAALDRYDLDAIERTLNRYAVLLPAGDLVFSVILPLLQQVGDRWQSGRLRPSHEHLVSAMVRSVLGSLLRASIRPNASPKVVFATPSGERHELGLLCAALLTATAGYGVVYLGADLPPADIAHAATTTGAQVVLVSLTTPGAVTRAVLKAVGAVPDGVELWIGGPQGDLLLSMPGIEARPVAGLADVVPMLERHARR